MAEIILASKSKVREEILINHNITCSVKPSNVDEDPVKYSLLKEGASPEIISKNLAELKANKVSNNIHDAGFFLLAHGPILQNILRIFCIFLLTIWQHVRAWLRSQNTLVGVCNPDNIPSCRNF